MNWLHDFQLYLFDFDGLLVDTEPLHYKAYKNILSKNRIDFPLTLERFYQLAHLSATALREAIFEVAPDLRPNWENFYQEKKVHYQELLDNEPVALMPGAERLLKALAKADLRRCIVTNSTRSNLERAARLQPILKTLSWITREDYREPKPHPECYQLAIALHGQPGDRIIGFEDSLRGWQSLSQASVQVPVLVTNFHKPPQGALCVPSLDHLCNFVAFP